MGICETCMLVIGSLKEQQWVCEVTGHIKVVLLPEVKGGVLKMAVSTHEVSLRPVIICNTSYVSRNAYEVVMRTVRWN